MSETIMKVSLDELTTIRIVCQKCHGIAEFSTSEIGAALPSQRCAFCQHPLGLGIDAVNTVYPVSELATAILHLKKIAPAVKIEFPIKIDNKSAQKPDSLPKNAGEN